MEPWTNIAPYRQLKFSSSLLLSTPERSLLVFANHLAQLLTFEQALLVYVFVSNTDDYTTSVEYFRLPKYNTNIFLCMSSHAEQFIQLSKSAKPTGPSHLYEN